MTVVMTKRKFPGRDATLMLTVLLGLASVVAVSRWIDAHRPATSHSIEEEELYLNASTVKRLSLGFNGLAADWYWMRSLQYVGGKILNFPEHVQLDHLGQLDLKMLAPLLDAATTLDPQFMEPYQYAAVVLNDIDVKEAIRIIERGIAANPSEWRLYHHLGFIYWQQKDFKKAGEAYELGSKISDAPPWMKAMRARMATEAGSRSTAREIYGRLYEEASDSQVKTMARKRLLLLDSLDMQDGLRKLMTAYKSKMGRCPGSWREMGTLFSAFRIQVDSSGAPLDPAGTPYLLVADKCDANVDEKSEVPLR
jgi:tetratricopeptide (TPR) repeat protein